MTAATDDAHYVTATYGFPRSRCRAVLGPYPTDTEARQHIADAETLLHAADPRLTDRITLGVLAAPYGLRTTFGR